MRAGLKLEASGGRAQPPGMIWDGQPPIGPSLCDVIATTEGRGGMSGLKSGQRVAGSSKVEARSKPWNSFVPSAPGCWTATKSVRASGVKQGPHISAPTGDLKEAARGAARFAFGFQREDAVRRAGCRVPFLALIGGDPEASSRIDGEIVRAGEPAVGRLPGVPLRLHRRVFRIAASDEDRPAEFLARVIAAFGRQLDDLAPEIFSARVWPVRVRRSALAVVGERDIDAMRQRIWLHVFRAVERRRAEQVGGAPRLDQHVGLGGETVRRVETVRAMRQGFPRSRAVILEAGDIERSLVEQVSVRRAVAREFVFAHELVEIFKLLVVAHVDGEAAILRRDGLAAFMFEAAERRALFGSRGGVERIDFGDPAEAVRLVGFGDDVEPLVKARPSHAVAGNAHALVIVRLGMIVERTREIEVHVFLAHEVGAPRGDAARAIVQGSDYGAAFGVGACAKPRVSGGRAGHPDLGVEHRDAAIVEAAGHRLPFAVGPTRDFDDAAAMRRHRHVDLLGCRVLDVREAWKHQGRIRVFVIDAEKAAIARLGAMGERHEADIVVVVAELPRLRAGALVHRVEGGGAGEDGVAPTDQNIGVVTLGDVMVLIDAAR